jgi:hypothetical protein
MEQLIYMSKELLRVKFALSGCTYGTTQTPEWILMICESVVKNCRAI